VRDRKVVILLHEPGLGGATSSVLGTVPRLEAEGWSFAFWVPGEGAARDELVRRGYEVGGEPRPLRYSRRALSEPPGAARRLAGTPGYLRRLRRWVAGQAPALVHANPRVTFPELLAARAGGRPTLMHVHEMLPGDARGRAAALLLRRAAGSVVACSTPCADALRRHGVTCSVVHEGIEPPEAVRGPRGGERLVVGTAGTISRRKGSDLFVAAATGLAGRLEADFRMAGELAPGPDEPWARELVGRAEAGGVRYMGRVDMAGELAELDVFVLPARRDPFPLTVLEAMAAGLPVIGTRVDGIAEQLDGDAGVLVDPESPVALAAAIERLAADQDLRARLGERARRRVVENFTVAHQAARLNEAYHASIGA
jgi:glycosyltransferase involved in cell wall biosynthesis